MVYIVYVIALQTPVKPVTGRVPAGTLFIDGGQIDTCDNCDLIKEVGVQFHTPTDHVYIILSIHIITDHCLRVHYEVFL